MTWIDGQERGEIAADDRGLAYGDGLFETMRVASGRVPLLDRHLARLVAGCARLGLAPPDDASLRRELAAACAGRDAGVLKLVLTRGSSGRGYRAPKGAAARRVISWHEASAWPADAASVGIRARTCATRLAVGSPVAGLKHLNRLEQVLARSEWQDEAIVEGLMSDAEGSIIAGTMTNLFLVVAGALRTPRLDRCGVAGVARAVVLECAAERGMRVDEQRITREALDSADALFVCNSVVGLWPLRELDGRACGASPLIETLQAAARAKGLP